MFEMIKAILFDILGLRPAGESVYVPPAPAEDHASGSTMFTEPTGYPVFDATGLVSVTEDHFGIL